MTSERPTGSLVGDVLRAIRVVIDPNWWPEAPDLSGTTVLLVPGFLAGDSSLAHLAAWLRSGGAHTERSGIRVNIDCMETYLASLEPRLERLVQDGGRRASVIGHSRGGTLARVLAARRPDLVERIVTLGTPTPNQLAFSSRPALAGTYLLGALGSMGLPGVVQYSCLRGTCCLTAREEMTRPVPAGVEHIAFYSRRDGVVKWEACLAPTATIAEIESHHLWMSLQPAVWEQVGEVLSHPVARAPRQADARSPGAPTA